MDIKYRNLKEDYVVTSETARVLYLLNTLTIKIFNSTDIIN